MQSTSSRAAGQRLALVAITSLWLSACGGGGGGGDATPVAAAPGPAGTSAATGTPASAPSASGPAAPSSSSSTAPAPSAGGPGVVAPPPSGPAPAPAISIVQAGDLWLTTSRAGEVQRYSRTARLADGTYVAVRDNFAPGQSDTAVLMRRLDAQGNPIGTETTLASGSRPGVAAFADGTFLVTWILPPPVTFTLTYGVAGQLYDAAGRPVGSTMNLGVAGSYAQPTAMADGTFVVATTAQDSHVNGPAGNLRRFRTDGTPTGFGAALREDACGVGGDASVAALPTGGFAVAWPYVCVGPREVRMRVYDASGALVASSRMPVSADGGVSATLATLTSGNVALQWTLSGSPTTLRELHTLVVAPTSLPDSPAGASTVPLQAGRTPLPVQSLAGGGFVVPWSALDEGEAQVPVSRFANSGAPL